MQDDQLKERTLARLEEEGLDHLIEPFGRCTLNVREGDEEGSAGRTVLDVALEGSDEDCALLRQHEKTLIDAIWRAGLERPDDPHINLTFCGESGTG